MNEISLYANCVCASVSGANEDWETRAATHLLPETDTWACVEGEEDERVRDKVLLHALVEEPVGVEHQRYTGPRLVSTDKV